LIERHLADLEVALQRLRERRSSLVVELVDEPVGREDGQSRVLQRKM
jgi:hypothetical protein